LATPLLRSVLYAPANRPDLVAKMERFAPDAVVIDLEDGTPAVAKESAREQAVEAAVALRRGYRGTIWLRVNAPASPWHGPDLATAASAAFDGLVVPKIESAEQVIRIEAHEAVLTRPDSSVLWGIETVAGEHRVNDILDASNAAAGAYFGAEDYVADLGGRRTRDSAETLVPRARVAIACRLAGILAIDQVVLDLADADHFRRDANAGIDLGYRGKNCIHPAQVPLCHEVYTPDAASVERARRLMECYERAIADGRGTADFEGQMIDAPLVAQARVVLDLAAAAGVR